MTQYTNVLLYIYSTPLGTLFPRIYDIILTIEIILVYI